MGWPALSSRSECGARHMIRFDTLSYGLLFRDYLFLSVFQRLKVFDGASWVVPSLVRGNSDQVSDADFMLDLSNAEDYCCFPVPDGVGCSGVCRCEAPSRAPCSLSSPPRSSPSPSGLDLIRVDCRRGARFGWETCIYFRRWFSLLVRAGWGALQGCTPRARFVA